MTGVQTCALPILKNLIEAHKSLYNLIHQDNQNAKVGISKNCIYFVGNPILSKLSDFFENKYFLNKIKNHQDFIGLNYYHRNRIKYFKFNQNENKKISDIGREIYPKGIYHALVDLRKYNKPIYITENGLADARDKKREWFIKETLKNVHKAIQDRSEEHTSELQSHSFISYAVFCLKKKKKINR